jgi:thiol-disulfide isomerase/thioredoxin
MIAQHKMLYTFMLCCVVGFMACGKQEESKPVAANIAVEPGISLAGVWRVVLESAGGELPFMLEVSEGADSTYSAVARNGEERLPFSSVAVSGEKVRFVFDHYDSFLEGIVTADSESMTGEWSRRAMGEERTRMNFMATKTVEHRFEPIADREPLNVMEDISGEWTVQFDGDEAPSLAIFKQEGRVVTGTFLTTLGDYRYLEGAYEYGMLRLSVFDGAHAFLFYAEVDPNGEMKGDFWSRDTYHTTWTATKGGVEMPDSYTLTKLTNEEQSFAFNFPDLDGKMVSNEDPRFAGKALIVCVFGTWCPNCNDEAQHLVELYREYHNQGLEIVGLANEFSENFEENVEMVRRFNKKYGITWTQLIVGLADKEQTAKALADLDRVLSYPTTLFIDREGKVQKIFTGYTGPGTGEHFDKLDADFRKTIEEILGL